MANVPISFEKIDGITTDDMRKIKISPGCDHANVHMIFDINMDGSLP